jgi:hypothetical protein
MPKTLTKKAPYKKVGRPPRRDGGPLTPAEAHELPGWVVYGIRLDVGLKAGEHATEAKAKELREEDHARLLQMVFRTALKHAEKSGKPTRIFFSVAGEGESICDEPPNA